MALDLWIPPSARPAYRCACGAQFTDKAVGIRHAIQCAKKHADEIAEEAEARNSSALGGPLDKEMYAWGLKRTAEGKVGFKRGRAA